MMDQRGRQGSSPPFGLLFFFIFMQFLGKIGQNNSLASLPLGALRSCSPNCGSTTGLLNLIITNVSLNRGRMLTTVLQ